MFRSFLLVAFFAVQAYGQLTLSGKFPVGSDTSGSITPVKDFSVVLTFSETVQKGGNSVSITVGDNANVAGDTSKISMSCSSPTAKWFNKVVLVPITSSGGLKAGTAQKTTVPSNCFKAYRASSTTNVYMNADATFSFTTEAANVCSNLASDPILITEKAVGGSSIPYSPSNGAWLTSPSSTKFDLYFSESLQAGEGLVSIMETYPSGTSCSTAATLDSFVPSGSKAAFDAESMKGRVQINKGSDWYKPGAKYSLKIANSAFNDKAGNKLSALFGGSADAYHVKVTTTLNNDMYPSNGCCGSSLTTNYTVNHKMIMNFAQNVLPGTGTVKLCSGWTPTSACSAGPTVATTAMLFLGKMIILNPQFTAGTTYNVSIPDTVYQYYAGISADADKKWTYGFSVDAATIVDTAPPELIAGYVDCDGDGILATTNCEESCNSDSNGGNDFMEISSTLSADGSSPMLTTAEFKLYFKETVELKTGAKATLAADDGTAAVDITTTGNGIAVGTSAENCVVTVDPTLKTGKKYTVDIASGQITDAATLKNPYAGTSFTFYTALTTASTFPTGTGRPKESLLKVSFTDEPRLGPTPPTEYTESPYATINTKTTVGTTITEADFQTLLMTDTNAVKFQGKDILMIPQTALAAGKTYVVKIPAHQLRYMTTDVSYEFSTRSEDITKPRVMAYGPTAATINKATLDQAGSSPAYPKVPYALFTEGVSTGAGQVITIYENGGGNMYNITASDTDCGSGSCVYIDTTYKNKVWLYPKGKTTATGEISNLWATAGKTYTVTLPDGSFTDEITTGVNMNPIDSFTWTFGVNGDVVGPTLASVELHAAFTNAASVALTSGTMGTSHTSMFLTFNENIQSGDNSMAIKSFDYSTLAPTFVPASSSTKINDKYALVSLSFDQKVQAGSGTVGLYKASGDALLGTASAVGTANYAGSMVFFTASTSLADATSYYIKGSAAGAIKGAGGTAMAAAINTKSTASMQYVKSQSTTTSRTVDILYNSLSEYACMASSSKLPDVTLYFSTIVTLGSSAYVNRTGGTCGSSNKYPGVTCDPDATSGATVCSTVMAANSGSLTVGIGAQATSKKYKATLYLSAKTGCTGTTLATVVNSFTTVATTTINTAAYSFTTIPAACAVAYDAPGSKLARVYMEPSTFAQKFSGSTPTMGKQYEVVIPAGAVKDLLGNTASTVGTAAWNHETVAPTMDSSSSSPASGSTVDEYESVTIAFNEVVQAGSGKFYMYDTSNTAGEAFAIDVTASTGEPGAVFFDKYVTITPKTTCFDTRRRVGTLNHTNATYVISCGGANESACPTTPTTTTTAASSSSSSSGNSSNSSRRLTDEEDSYDESWEGSEAAERRLQSTTCRTLGDLEAGKTYYVMTAATGVVKDVFGNLLAPINTKNSWSISVNAASGTDSRAPKVVYASTPSAVFSDSWGVGPTLSGKVMFSEKLKTKTGGSSITLQDCGTDMTCGSGNDDVITTIPSTALSYGDGTATDGTKEYGLLQYTKQVPTANSKFKFSIPASAVEDFSGGTNNAGPSAEYSFYFAVGDVAYPTGTDSTAPTVVLVTPTATASLASTTDLVLYFNEDVQKGSGVVSFCTNSDASSTVPCTTGAFTDGTAALYAVDNVTTLDRRVLSVNLPSIKTGQTLYAMMPAGLVKDNSMDSNALASGMLTSGATTYSFSITDEDTVAPILQVIMPQITSASTTTISTSDKIKLYFSEAIQAGTGANVVVLGSNSSITGLTTTIAGNQVHIGYSWVAGTTYALNMGFDAFKDLQGTTLSSTTTAEPPALAPTDQKFIIAGDSTAPTGSFTNTAPITQTTASASTVFELNFNEVVQKGTGKISIYSSGTVTSGSTTGTRLEEFDVTSLPLVSSVGAGSMMMSSTVVQGSASMKVGYAYRLIVPTTAYKDVIGNAYTGMSTAANTNYKKMIESADCQDPVFLTASMGDTAGTGSNAAFPTASGKIVMYFSENVQSASSGSVKLQASNGGSFCSGTDAGCATASAACSTACDYDAASTSDVTLTSLTISGNTVTAAVPGTLQSGKGYKLTIDRRAFTDATGNSLTTTLPGDATAGMIYTVQIAASTSSTDSTGPLHKTTGTPAAVTGLFPTSGSSMMPPSTAIVVSFDETVQAGTGSVSFGSSTNVAVSSCQFSTTFMRCKPSADLATGTAYDVSFAQAAITDVAGNSLRAATVGSTNSKLTFTTVDLDYMPPTLAAVDTASTYATVSTAKSVAYATPYDPTNGAADVAKGTLITMTFSETVQAGAGNLLIGGSTASGVFYYSGTTVYLQQCCLTAGASYAITTSQAGVFKDLSNQPVATISSGFSFTVVADDGVAPSVLQMLPKDDTTVADDAPSTMINLYFSEAVQAITGGVLTVGPSSAAVTIPVDNTAPSKGSVTVVGAAVSIDPFDDVGYGKTVDIKIAAGAFKDLFGANNFAATNYQFRTPAFEFSATKTNNATIGFSQREGAVLYSMGTYMLLYGGIASGCLADGWTSTTGATWTSVSLGGASPGATAYAKSAQDENGCVVVMGSSGAGCADSSKAIYKTCGVNSTTTKLEWTSITAAPMVKGDAEWTYTTTGISGHGIAIVGGWKLVIVDSVNGVVWNFLDKEMGLAQQVATSVPFAKRTDPILLTDSTNILYLLGGYDGTACSATDVSCSAVFTDTWHSADFGATWACLTANYDQTMTSTYTKGIGRHVGAVMTHDDYMFLIAGSKANATVSLNDIWTSATPATEANKPIPYPSAMVPASGATGVLSDSTITLYFDEVVSYKSGGALAPALVDNTNTTVTFSIATSISRQVMTISLTGTQKFPAGDTIAIKVPSYSLQDTAGNTLASDLSYTFTVNADAAKPTFDSFTTTSNSSLGWDYRATSTSMLVITTSQFVYPVSGIVNVTSSIAGSAAITFDINDPNTDVYNYGSKGMIFFTLPEGMNYTENTMYTISIPAGMVADAAGNLNGAYDRFTFKTISGANSYNDYANPIATVAAIPTGPGMVNDTAKPTFVSMWPPVGAGDVLAAADTAVYLFFNEPVKFNATHPALISIINNTNKVCGSVNLTYEYVVSSEPIVGHATELNATKMTIGAFLKKDQNFTISVPAGVIVDMKNNPIDAFTKTFKTLAETTDTVAPVVVNAAPFDGKTTVLSTEYSMSVWFSERVTAGAGSITIKTGTTAVTMDITDANLTIAGPKMAFSFYPGALSKTGTWNLILPPGLLKDAAGNQYKGLNNSGGTATQDFTVIAADTTKPTLSSQLPAHETTPGYTRSVSTACQLTFSETVQAASGKIVFTPKYTSPTLSVDAVSSEVALTGSIVAVSPTIDLMPGEVYGITIGAGAFTDVEGNAYAGLTTGYTISTYALITWGLTSSENFDEGAANYFEGERYGASCAVDGSNNLYVVGGHNGTAGSAMMLNDVFKLATMRDVNCAASIQPTFDCTVDGEAPDGSNAVTVCTGVNAGKSNFNRTIWKAPSAGGKKCQMVPSGDFASELGQIIEASFTYCPCPLCTFAPPEIGPETPTFNAIDDYTFADALPVMGNLEELNLTCQTGYEPNGGFVCGFDTLETGKFLTPYPECQLAPCRELPTLGDFMSLDAMQCNSTMTRFADGSVCNYVCDDGYGILLDGKGILRGSAAFDGVFTCNQGVWELDYPGSCVVGEATTTAAPAPPPATAAPMTTTTPAGTETYVTHSVGFVQDFGDATEDSLMADTGFTASLSQGLLDGFAAAVTELAGLLTLDSILLEKFTLSAVRRLTEYASRRLQAKKLTVDYAVKIPAGVSTSPEALGATLVANKGAFESTMASSYAAAYEANTGAAPPGFTGVEASDTAGVKVVTPAPPAPAPTPGPAPTPTPTPTPAPPAPAPSPSPGPAPSPSAPSAPAPAEEEGDDNTGMIVGIVVGVILGAAALGGIFYMYKKKKAAE